MKYFSSNLEFLRKRNGLKQLEIQEKLGIERTTWSNYERGRSFPNLKLFHEISKYFGISEYDLLNTDLTKLNYPPSEKLIISNGTPHEKKFLTDSAITNHYCTYCILKDEIIHSKEQIIAALQGQIEALKIAAFHMEERIKHLSAG